MSRPIPPKPSAPAPAQAPAAPPPAQPRPKIAPTTSQVTIGAGGNAGGAVPRPPQPTPSKAAVRPSATPSPVARPSAPTPPPAPTAKPTPAGRAAPVANPPKVNVCTPDDPDGNGAVGFQQPIDPKTAPNGTVLGQARGRQPGATWETKTPAGLRVVNTIPPGNGDQTVDQVVYGPDGRVQSRIRVVSNGRGGYQQWVSHVGGDSVYEGQDAPGANVRGMAWRHNSDTATAAPYTLYGSTWDGTTSAVEQVGPDGKWARLDSARAPDGTLTQRRTTADGTVTTTQTTPDGKTRTIGSIDAAGRGWFDDGNGGKSLVHRDKNGNPVVVTTDSTTGSVTTEATDPTTGLVTATVVDKQGRRIGQMHYDAQGNIVSGVLVQGGVRSSWVNGVLTLTHDGSSSLPWKRMTVNPDGTGSLIDEDGSIHLLGADGKEAGFIDKRSWWQKYFGPAKDAASTVGRFYKGELTAGWHTVQGLGSLVGWGPTGGPGIGEAWWGAAKGIGNLVWTDNPQVLAGKMLYDAFRLSTSEPGAYVAQSPGDRLGHMTNSWIGVDFRDFGRDDVDKAGLAGQTAFGVGMLIAPTKGASSLKVGTKAVPAAREAAVAVGARLRQASRTASSSIRNTVRRSREGTRAIGQRTLAAVDERVLPVFAGEGGVPRSPITAHIPDRPQPPAAPTPGGATRFASTTRGGPSAPTPPGRVSLTRTPSSKRAQALANVPDKHRAWASKLYRLATNRYIGKWLRDIARGQLFNLRHQHRYLANEVYVDILDSSGKRTGRVRIDSYDPRKWIVSRKHTQLGAVKIETAMKCLTELQTKYPALNPEFKISDVSSAHANSALKNEIGKMLRGRQVLEVPVQTVMIPDAVLKYARKNQIIIRDVTGRRYT